MGSRELTTTTNLDFPFLLPGESAATDDPEAGGQGRDPRADTRCGGGPSSAAADRGTDRELLLDDGQPRSDSAAQRGVISRELAQVHSPVVDTTGETLDDGSYDVDDDMTKLSSVEQC